MRGSSNPAAGSNPDAPVRPARKSVGQQHVAGEMGWLLAAIAAFVLIHIVAGTLDSPASEKETPPSGLEAISSLYD
jgi:hypothetical protein